MGEYANLGSLIGRELLNTGNGIIFGRMGGGVWMDRWMDGWMDGWIDGWIKLVPCYRLNSI